MSDKKADVPDAAKQRQRALSRWSNEGGGPRRSQESMALREAATAPPLTNAELVQLHVRVIALENLLIALLAEASERQLEIAREMADYISPRPGFTRHPATVHAAGQMSHLIERSTHFRTAP